MGLAIKVNKKNIEVQQILRDFIDQGSEVVVGKQQQLHLSLCCLLSRGHLLIEDIPGVGKTTMVKYLAAALGLEVKRIQFTNDLLPSDILGSNIYNREKGSFEFHPGPLFAEVVVADELNRATPKTQSACLQAMEERQVTIDGKAYSLPDPFFVIATQNPQSQMGTYPLPESQLDRFLMSLQLGYPDFAAERTLLKGANRQTILETIKPILSINMLCDMQAEISSNVHVSDPIIDYIHRLLIATRDREDCYGLSPRAGLALVAAAKAWAYLQGRNWVAPEDVQAVFSAVASHRMSASNSLGLQHGWQLSQEIVGTVRVD